MGLKRTDEFRKVFLEDRHDHQNDAHHRAQLFSVMMDSFLPITRAQEGAFNKSLPWPRGHQRHFHFLVRDVVDLNQIPDNRLGISLTKPLIDYRDVFAADPYDFGLQILRSIDPTYKVEFQQEAFVAHADEGLLQTVMTCNIDGSVEYPGCTQWFRTHGLDVKLSFRKPYLSEWKQMQEDVDRFLECATKHGARGKQ